MDHNIFDYDQAFYMQFRMTDRVTGRIYTPDFSLNVLSLKQIDKATKEDIESGLVYWAKLFKSTTWEELKQNAEGRADITEVVRVMYEVNVDDKRRAILDARRKYREIMTTTLNEKARLTTQLEESNQKCEQYRIEKEQYREKYELLLEEYQTLKESSQAN